MAEVGLLGIREWTKGRGERGTRGKEHRELRGQNGGTRGVALSHRSPCWAVARLGVQWVPFTGAELCQSRSVPGRALHHAPYFTPPSTTPAPPVTVRKGPPTGLSKPGTTAGLHALVSSRSGRRKWQQDSGSRPSYCQLFHLISRRGPPRIHSRTLVL